MNCKDISRILDECEIAGLTAAAQAAVAAHCESCAGCDAQWQIGNRLLGFRADTPPVPPALRERARELEAAQDGAGGRPLVRRPVIIGSLLLFGATAAMLAGVPWRGQSAELAE